jgi:hypothetical protein
LRTAERLAPQDVRRPSVQQLTRELLDHPGAEPDGLAAFANRIGATTSM